jgi:Spherulation-specific family 4
MRHCWHLSLLCLLFFLYCDVQASNQPRLAVPSYVSPTAKEWNAWASLGSQRLGLMILNLNNGDDARYDAALAAAVKSTQDSGILVLGYIYTGYAKRDPAEIRAKIDGVFKSYRVDGIFLDETPTDCKASGEFATSNFAYYEALTDYIRSKPGKHDVILNPGTVPEEDCWMKAADILVTFEEATLANYEKDYVDREWIHRYPLERFWHLVYSVPSTDEMRQVVKLARRRGVGWLYVTDDGPDKNPWDEPASYLAVEAKEWTGVEPETPKGPPNSPAARRVSIQWSGLKGVRSQIFLDVDKKASTGYCGRGTALGADLMLEMPGDGSVKLNRYNGTGEDWQWTAVEAHVTLTQPQPGTNRIEFDATPLGSATTVKIQFLSLDVDWNAVWASKVFDWNPQ